MKPKFKNKSYEKVSVFSSHPFHSKSEFILPWSPAQMSHLVGTDAVLPKSLYGESRLIRASVQAPYFFLKFSFTIAFALDLEKKQ